jgi:hypothetical protein
MDFEQLKQDFLEEIAGPIDLFLQENRQRMADTMSAKAYDKVGMIKHVLTELERVIQHYRATKLPIDYLNKVLGIIKPVLSIGRDTELLEIEKILVGITKLLNQERGMKSLSIPRDEDDTEALKDDLWTAFKNCPTSDYQTLKKVMSNDLDIKQQFMIKHKVVSSIKQDYNKETDGPLVEYIESKLKDIFFVLWDDEFEALALQNLQDERERAMKSLGGVKESVRAAMLTKLMA